jgi:hypothetical protein
MASDEIRDVIATGDHCGQILAAMMLTVLDNHPIGPPGTSRRAAIGQTRGEPMPGLAPPLTDERQLLLAYVAQQRDGVRYAAHGLTDEQARLAPTASPLTVGGLVKHAAQMERSWIDTALQRESAPVDYDAGFRLGDGESLADALADLEAAGRETETAFARLGLDDPVPVPRGVPWFPDDVEAWSVRWVLLHLVEELARHAGHADIIRESIDGATMYQLMAAAEGWPATEWMEPLEA